MGLFAKDQWPSDVFFARAKAAKSLEPLLDLNMAPRMELPVFAAAPVAPGTAARTQASATAELSDLQRETVDQAIEVNQALPVAARVTVPAAIESPADAHNSVQSVAAAVIASHPVNQ